MSRRPMHPVLAWAVVVAALAAAVWLSVLLP
jgi:hypothetical protein